MKNVINRALVAKKRNILTLVLAIVSSVWMMSEAQINSLCDTWNVLEIYGDLGPEEEIWRTTHYTMGGPKTINDKVYYTVSKDGAYAGALREAGNGRIYIYPSNGWQQEFLIYDFNAQVGDTLRDLYIGNRYFEYGPKILYATVKEIKPTTPRTFVLDVVYIFPGIEDAELVHWEIEWVEGVGLTDGPIGNVCPLDCEGGPGMKLLCAYKNGKQIYTSEAGEKYGCEYNGDPVGPQTTDTIPLPSLCDTWNVLVSDFMWPYADKTHIQHLANDTLIGGQRYTQLQSNRDGNFTYKGSLREGINRDIYYVPVNSTNEYLIYAFNAQEGDVLENVWLGGEQEQKDCTNAHNATVIEISNSNPRIFTLEIIPFTSYEGMEVYPYWMEWIEGVGMSDGPVGAYDSNKLCPSAADLGVFTLLCAYKNGEQVYVSEAGEKYGCEYNYNPYTTPTDTIPLYSRDDSGSSTVDPVDPNQIYATLTGDKLTVHNNTGAQVTFTLNNTSVNNIAARVRSNVEPVSFTDSVSVELSEDGIYEILLTSEEWNYTVFGTVNYIRSGTDVIKEETHTTKKVLRGTQILIEREGKTYTLTGQEVK